MAENFSMLIVVVDLDCHKCYNKIRKILCELQYHERIQTISLDDKSKTITIVGPFDPLRLACKLRCKGGKVVKDIHIVDNGGGGKQKHKEKPPPTPEPEPVRNGKQKHKEKPPACPQSPAQPAPPDGELPPACPQSSAPLPPACPDRPLEQPVEYVIPTVEIPSLGPCWCPCCAPCYQGYYERCRCCCCCGSVYGATVQPLPAPCGYRGCRTFSYDDPSAACSIM